MGPVPTINEVVEWVKLITGELCEPHTMDQIFFVQKQLVVVNNSARKSNHYDEIESSRES